MLRQTTTIRIEEITIEPDSTVVNKKLAEVFLKDKFGLLILAIMRSGAQEIIYSPSADTVLAEGFILVVMGEIQDIQRAKEFVKG